MRKMVLSGTLLGAALLGVGGVGLVVMRTGERATTKLSSVAIDPRLRNELSGRANSVVLAEVVEYSGLVASNVDASYYSEYQVYQLRKLKASSTRNIPDVFFYANPASRIDEVFDADSARHFEPGELLFIRGDYAEFAGKSDEIDQALTAEFGTLRVNKNFPQAFAARYWWDVDTLRDQNGEITFDHVWAEAVAMARVEPPPTTIDEKPDEEEPDDWSEENSEVPS
jgi:hypothetical protein